MILTRYQTTLLLLLLTIIIPLLTSASAHDKPWFHHNLERVIEIGSEEAEDLEKIGSLLAFTEGSHEKSSVAIEQLFTQQERDALAYFNAEEYLVERIHHNIDALTSLRPFNLKELYHQLNDALVDGDQEAELNKAIYHLGLYEGMTQCYQLMQCQPEIKIFIEESNNLLYHFINHKEQAHALLLSLAERDNPNAQLLLAKFYIQEQLNEAPNPERQQMIYQLLVNAADSGLPEAARILGLGLIIDHSDHQERNAEALHYLKVAADANDALAAFTLATLVEEEEQMAYLKKAISLGFMVQYYWLEEYLTPDPLFQEYYLIVDGILAEIALFETTLLDLMDPLTAYRYEQILPLREETP